MNIVHFPLPLRPKKSSQEPCVIIPLGEDNQNKSYQLGQVFDLTNNYIPRLIFINLRVKVIGFYQNKVLVKLTETGADSSGLNPFKECKKYFWDNHNSEDYQEISQEEYLWLLDSHDWSS